MLRNYGLASALLIFGLTACSGGEDPVDAGDPPVDAGQPPVDAGQPPVDAGQPDTGVEPDAGQPDAGVMPDAGMPDTGVEPDAGPPPPDEVDVSGRVIRLGRYLAGERYYMPQVGILSYGVNPTPPPVNSVDNPEGGYDLVLPANGQAVLVTNRAGYNQTFNPITTQDTPIIDRTLYITERDWLASVATNHNVDLNTPFACQTAALAGETCLYSVIVGRILDDGAVGNGVRRPVAGIAPTDFTITGGPNDAPWYARGPYFLNYDGTPGEYPTSVDYQNGNGDYVGGLFVTFVEIPVAGPQFQAVQLRIAYGEAPTRYFGPTTVQAFRAPGGAVTWQTIYETGAPPPPPVNGIDFDSQVYPLFLPVDQGGLGCQGCHTNQGGATPAGGMNLYGGPAEAFASLNPQQYPTRVNLQSPGDSYLLVRPLYEADGNQDHPIFAFLSEQDPGYQTIYTWIQEGAQRNVPNPPVSFYNDVRPLLYQPSNNGGAGCVACHGDPQNARGGFYVGGDGNDLYDALVNTPPTNAGRYNEAYRINRNNYPERSLVLSNPLFGDEEPHPVKIFSDVTDPRYVLIYQWIDEGYVNDTP